MNDEQELRDRLRAIDVPPSRIEVDALVRAGRRRAFRRRSVRTTGGVALAAAVLLAVPSILTRAQAQPSGQAADTPVGPSAEVDPVPPTGPSPRAASSTPSAGTPTSAVGCSVTELPVPPGMTGVTVTAVDPTGRYVVGNSLVGQDFRPILWVDGKPLALPVPGTSVQVTAVNAGGVAVGLVQDGEQEYVFRYQNGRLTRLRTPVGNWHPYPEPAINVAGDVVVNVEPQGNSGGKGSVVLLWRAGSTTPVTLPLPAGASAHDITDAGTIVGGLYRNGVGVGAYVWDQRGTARKLTVPAGETGLAYAARGEWATGGLWPSGSAARWNLRTGEVTDLGSVGQADMPTPGEAVNAAGWVVAHGVVLRDGAVVELTTPAGQTGRAVDVSENGLVVGQAVTGGRDDTRVLGPRMWRC